MKDVLSLTAFAGKLLCLIVFVAALKPDSVAAVSGVDEPRYCKIGRPGVLSCGLNVPTAASKADVEPCSVRSSVAHC